MLSLIYTSGVVIGEPSHLMRSRRSRCVRAFLVGGEGGKVAGVACGADCGALGGMVGVGFLTFLATTWVHKGTMGRGTGQGAWRGGGWGAWGAAGVAAGLGVGEGEGDSNSAILHRCSLSSPPVLLRWCSKCWQ